LVTVARSILSGTARVSPPVELLQSGDVEVDLIARTVTRSGHPVELTRREFDLLAALGRRNGAVASRADLLREIWGSATQVRARVIDVHIARLRRKLERDPSHPRWILTASSRGYRFAVGVPANGEGGLRGFAASEG
jgi:DNA-binding response OmpR family regulator